MYTIHMYMYIDSNILWSSHKNHMGMWNVRSPHRLHFTETDPSPLYWDWSISTLPRLIRLHFTETDPSPHFQILEE